MEAIDVITVSWNLKDDMRKEHHLITFYVLPECMFGMMIGRYFLSRTVTMTAIRHSLSQMPRPRMALSLRMVKPCSSPGHSLKGILNLRGCSALSESGAEPSFLFYKYAKQRG